jgi:arabinogalactan endo-1,4-beta-galactosidase
MDDNMILNGWEIMGKWFSMLSSLIIFLGLFSSTFSSSAAAESGSVPANPKSFIKGVDVSSLKAVEDHGGKFYNHGKEQDALTILKSYGVNYIRLRIWNNPVEADGYNDLEDTIVIAKRAKSLGLKFLLDFHYSDFWADPGKQYKPAAWQDLSDKELENAVYEYTKEVITELKEAKALPDMVQIGNEIQSGILWPTGKTWGEGAGGFDELARLLNAGIKGVKDSLDQGERVKIMLHLGDGGNNSLYRWFFDEITKRGVDFDVIGLSYYPIWHGTLADLQNNMNDISKRYNKEVVVAETAYAYTLENGDDLPNIFGSQEAEIGGYPVSVQGQAKFLKDLMNVVQQVPDGKGLGIFYWEATWIPVKGAGWKSGEGNAWENQAMFDFYGNALPSLHVFRAAQPIK